ncbi:hypothetical protein QFC19_003341 [Naganishia cerealis]|uniref:Uncharacterized protein n=1 Tax=Naganishia cerealis TaxID=610337 RepID=A0ACC2W4G0_9TREE|nr:hypothetical protein QFC19_003341 [Naganishia cerealis]
MPILGLTEPGPTQPAHFALEAIIRPNILALVPYRSARDDYDQGILLDANENALGPCLPAIHDLAIQRAHVGVEDMPKVEEEKLAQALSDNGESEVQDNGSDPLLDMSKEELAALNRYPSPTHDPLKARIAALRGVPNPNWVFLGVGSDEVIDLLFRVSCVPGKDVVITTPPTYGMYEVAANVNDVGVCKVPLTTEGRKFEVDMPAMERAFAAYPDAKLLFLCSPGNPTGTLIPLDTIRAIASNPAYKGIVVVDEAYIDFAPEGTSAVELVNEFANVCVMQTLSKGFGLAGIRLGFALAPPPLVQIMTNTKAPYNVSKPTATLALSSVSPRGISILHENITALNKCRAELITALQAIPGLGDVLGGNDANFVLVQVLDKPREQGGRPSNPRAVAAYKHMAEQMGLVVRFRGNERGCEGCLRITVGSPEECEAVVERLKQIL